MEPVEKNNLRLLLFSGGPMFSLLRLIRLADQNSTFAKRRALVAISVAWVPLLFLSFADSGSTGLVNVAFLHDFEAHARFLIAVPIFITAEPFVQKLIAQRCLSFITRQIVLEKDLPKFQNAVTQAHSFRNSWLLEISLVVLVYTVGLYFWRSTVALSTSTWYAHPSVTGLNLTMAGYWYMLLSLPLMQFLSLRWYSRFFVWFWFLRQVSKLELKLVTSHPDRAGGLGFLGKATYAFGPILFAQGAVLSGMIATQVMYNGGDLFNFRLDAALFIVFFVAAVLSPLCVFIPKLVAAKRRGLNQFGVLASQYTSAFEDKWICGNNPENEPLLGSGDIQSLADLGNSYSVVKEMNMAPFVYQDVLRLAASASVPLIPLGLLVFSPDQLLDKILSFVF